LGEMRVRGAVGELWLTTPKASTVLYDQRGQCWCLTAFLQQRQAGEQVDEWVFLGQKERLPVRLLATRVSAEQAQRRRRHAKSTLEGKVKGIQRPNERGRAQGSKRLRQRKRKKTGAARFHLLDWTILISNVPQERLSLDEALVLARCRWQIELCWKLWKQIGKVDTWRSAKPERIMTEIFAKLLGLLFSHWLTVLGCWQSPNRSVVKAHQVVQWMAPALALGVAGVVPLDLMVQRTTQTMASGCRINSRRQKPNTYQLVAQPNLIHS